MGHYSDYYDISEDDAHSKEKQDLIKLVKDLKYTEDIKMLSQIIKDLNNWRGFYKLINHLS